MKELDQVKMNRSSERSARHAQQVDSQDAEDLRALSSETVKEIQRHDRASSTHGQAKVVDDWNTAVLCCFTKAQVAVSLRHQ